MPIGPDVSDNFSEQVWREHVARVARLSDLGILGLDRARIDDDVDACDVLGAVAHVDADAERLQAARRVARAQIRARDVERTRGEW